jgi:sugar phosphate isomerase/epimerase
MKLGISSYTYGWAVGVCGYEPASPLDEHGLLDHAREHGVKLLQIGDNLPLHTFDNARLDRLAKRAANEGVQLEVGARRLTVERVADYAAIARRLGATLIRFVIDDADFHPSPDEVTATLVECAPLLDGLTLGIENHDRFSATTLRSMIEAAGGERIGVCLDTANSLGAGEGLAAVASTLAPLTVNLHIKDFHIGRVPYLMGFSVTGRPAGQGFVDVPTLLALLAPFRRCHTAILELWTPPEPQLAKTIATEAAWAAESLDFLRPIFTQSAPA